MFSDCGISIAIREDTLRFERRGHGEAGEPPKSTLLCMVPRIGNAYLQDPGPTHP
jgi:hypothetical protein